MARHEVLSVGKLLLDENLHKKVTVAVAAAAAAGASANDAELVGGEIVGIVPAGNQDQFVDNVAIDANGAVTVTLGAAAVAINTFAVTVMRSKASFLS